LSIARLFSTSPIEAVRKASTTPLNPVAADTSRRRIGRADDSNSSPPVESRVDPETRHTES
jgi:hypothetical protein